MTALTAPQFLDADLAQKHLEALRWPNGPICPHCRSEGKAWALTKHKESAKTRPGYTVAPVMSAVNSSP